MQYVDDAADENTLVRSHRKNDFNDIEISNLSQTILNFDPPNQNHGARIKYGGDAIDNGIDESKLVRTYRKNDFHNIDLTN